MDYKSYYLSTLEQLSSPSFGGRSAYSDGDVRAARLIMDLAGSIDGLVPEGGNMTAGDTVRPPYKSVVAPGGEGRWASADSSYLQYLQHFQIPMNVMRGDMAVSIDGKPLLATYDFTAKEFSPSCHGAFKVAEVPDEMVTSDRFVEYLNSGKFKDTFAVVSWEKYLTLPCNPFERYIPYLGKLDSSRIAGVILRDKDLFQYFKSRSYYNLSVPVLMMTSSAVPSSSSEISVDIDAEMIPAHDCHNIVTYLPGTEDSASDYYTLIAHYDHLGLEGRDNVFPGANDNAGGDAFLLTLAHYFSAHRPRHGIQFIWLDAEEENLLGSFYYCGNPVRSLSDIRMLLNFDMIADNGDILDTECNTSDIDLLGQVNSSLDNPFDIVLRDEFTDNSDHYAFGVSGVPCFYFSFKGDYEKYYHSPRDVFENCSADNFDRLFELVTRYIETSDKL